MSSNRILESPIDFMTGLKSPIVGDRVCKRLVMATPLFLAGYIILQCPCGKLPSCHSTEFYTLIAIAVAMSLFELYA